MTTYLRSTLRSTITLSLGGLLILTACLPITASARTLHVSCPGIKISNTIRDFAQPGDTIRVTGTCKERVVITKDRITIDGSGRAVLDGAGVDPSATEFNPLVLIDGARGVLIRGMTIQNSSGEGVLAQNGAAVVLQDVTARDNGFTGIAVSTNSTAELVNCAVDSNALGIDAFNNASVVLKGTIDVRNNENGVEINGQSTLEIRGGQVVVNDNKQTGILAGNSSISIFGFTESLGSSLTVSGNGTTGILLPSSTLEVVGGRFFGSGANVITVSNNGENGIWLPDSGGIASPFSTAKFIVESNPTGIRFGQSAVATIIGGLTVRNNGTGVLADGAGGLTLISIPPNPSLITDNIEVDADLRFGSRATFDGPPFVGTVVCDATAAVRGSAGCP